MKYQPLWPYYWERRKQECFTVIMGDFVSADAGTGIVHCAPGFGEEDYKVCLANNLITAGNAPVPVDQDGIFKEIIEDYKGMYIKDADKVIMKDLKEAGRLLAQGTIVHSYPYCWRS